LFFIQGNQQNPLAGLIALLQLASSQIERPGTRRADDGTGSAVALTNLSYGPGSVQKEKLNALQTE
jgi:hypothetical protein